MQVTSRPQVRRPAAAAATSAAAKSGQAAAAPVAVAGGAQAAVPTTSLMGIPAEEVTPKVKVAIETLMKEVERLRQDVEDMKRRNGELEKLADEDAMLPVVNRRAFVRELSRSMSFAQRYDQPSSLAFFDVNNMKTINDTLGHGAGDAALMHVAQTLVESVRHSDVVGRLGGDEFGVILSHVDDAAAHQKTQELADKIKATPVQWQGETFNVSIAFGDYTFHGSEDASAALRAADEAMYKQKREAAAE